jgi:hypothetical protein
MSTDKWLLSMDERLMYTDKQLMYMARRLLSMAKLLMYTDNWSVLAAGPKFDLAVAPKDENQAFPAGKPGSAFCRLKRRQAAFGGVRGAGVRGRSDRR